MVGLVVAGEAMTPEERAKRLTDEWKGEGLGYADELTEFIASAIREAVEEEREACAKGCEVEAAKWEGGGTPDPMSRICAAAIRAHGGKR